MLAISLTIACSRYIYNGVILHEHPVRGESHNQRNTTGEVATLSKHFILPCLQLGTTNLQGLRINQHGFFNTKKLR